jgi:hypothetical protein
VKMGNTWVKNSQDYHPFSPEKIIVIYIVSLSCLAVLIHR